MVRAEGQRSRCHPALAWAASGGMWLTGPAAGPPLVPAGSVLAWAQQRLDDLNAAVAGWGSPVPESVPALLFGRAAWMGLSRQGRVSANGTGRLLRAADGWVAINLARPEDVESVPAIIGSDDPGDPWDLLVGWAAGRSGAEVVARVQLLAVPAAVLPAASIQPGGRKGHSGAGPPAQTIAEGFDGASATALDAANASLAGTRPVLATATPSVPPQAMRTTPPVVVDLSALWAGPLCAHLLSRAGARVTKVESATRPDGARRGHPGFWSWLHAGQDERAVDLGRAEGRAELLGLIRSADIVVDSSRPRALAQLGIVAEEIVAEARGLTWVSITGYGRAGDFRDRVAFGDDAAVAGGLVAWDGDEAPVFCGDAIADPLSGLAAAAAAAAAWNAGGGGVLDVSMAAVAADAAVPPQEPGEPHEVHLLADGGWAVTAAGRTQPVLPPHPPVDG